MVEVDSSSDVAITAQDVPISKSPEGGMWPEPISNTNFVVAWPPVGAEGTVVAKDADGDVVSTWELCLDAASTSGVDYTACDESTEFWEPIQGR